MERSRGNGCRSSTPTASITRSACRIHNSWYIDLSANYPINDAWTFNAHVGRQEYKGSTNGVSNNVFDYTDWKLGVTWAVNGYNIGAYYTDTNAKDAGYTLAGRNIGKATGYGVRAEDVLIRRGTRAFI